MFNPGDIVEWQGQHATVLAQKEVEEYWGAGMWNVHPGKVWARWSGSERPTNLPPDMVRLVKRKLPRRTMPEWF